ncbi:hypothetical protein [Shewanella algae]|uniref:hypothetical protein n=1 Tax=Shewanella algae TaxID=38313 RepID=UPI0031F59B15
MMFSSTRQVSFNPLLLSTTLVLTASLSCALVGSQANASQTNASQTLHTTQTVQPSEAKAAIRHEEGRQIYGEQMEGKLLAKDGQSLPDGVAPKTLLDWLAPGRSPDLLASIGAKPWGNQGLYLGYACVVAEESDLKYTDGSDLCSENFAERQTHDFYFGVFKLDQGNFQALATHDGPLNTPVNWNDSNLESTVDGGSDTVPQSVKKLDLAPYKVSDQLTAIGIRVGFSEGFSGGGAFYEALQLYVIDGDKLVNIFSEPMYFYKDLAGERDETGVRARVIDEGKNLLQLLGRQHQGYYDLRLKNVDNGSKVDFRWSRDAGRYLPKNGG